MGLGSKALLLAAAMVCAAAPAFAYRADATITAVDFAFRANGTDATTLTIAPGQTVTFSYPTGKSTHNVVFTGPKPTCSGLPPFPYPPQLWKEATCTFDQPGTYAFVCGAHPGMTGTIVVAAPTPSPTATPTGSPGADPDPITPGATPAPTATPDPVTASTPAQQQPATLSLKLAGRQRGARVRGSLSVAQAPARVEVTLRSGKSKAGSWTKPSAGAGRLSFSVAVNARTRKALRAKRHLKLTVTVTLTPRGGKSLTTTAKATVSL